MNMMGTYLLQPLTTPSSTTPPSGHPSPFLPCPISSTSLGRLACPSRMGTFEGFPRSSRGRRRLRFGFASILFPNFLRVRTSASAPRGAPPSVRHDHPLWTMMLRLKRPMSPHELALVVCSGEPLSRSCRTAGGPRLWVPHAMTGEEGVDVPPRSCDRTRR